MKSSREFSGFRAAACAALLALLGVSGYTGALRENDAISDVPVSVQYYDPLERSAMTAGEIARDLGEKRREEIALLDSVIDNPASSEEIRQRALEQKSQIAQRMEQEAQAEAALCYAGYAGVGVLCSLTAVNIFSPYAYMADENDRTRMIDCVCTQTGVQPGEVKIILAKNE